KDKPKEAAQAPGGALRKYTGFTRPGNPSDRREGDKIVVVPAGAKEEDDESYGGTIYFAVFENQGDKAVAGDMFGTGIKDFDTTFKRGKTHEGMTAPELKKKSKYLYLYQTVNDRGTPGIITSTSVRLIIHPRLISRTDVL